ncbi:MAG: hypothetical protein ABIP48_28440 [Planctomycetota bacterium]
MIELKTYEVSGRPSAPGSKLPSVDPLVIEAGDATDAMRQAVLLWGLGTMTHRYTMSAVDTDPARVERERTERLRPKQGAIIGYGFK